MRSIVFLVVTALTAASVFGADEDKKRSAMLTSYIESQMETWQGWKEDLVAAKRGRVNSRFKKMERLENGNYVFPTRQTKEKRVAELENMLKTVIRSLPSRKLRLGDIGEDRYSVRQVTSKSSALCNRSYPVGAVRVGNTISTRYEDELVMLREVDTTGWTDNSDEDKLVDTPLIAIETTTYKTAAGTTNTVMVLEPLTSEEIEQIKAAVGR